MRDPQAQPPYRVHASHIDDLFIKDRPPGAIRPAVGRVTKTDTGDSTILVNDAEETITVVALGDKPQVGDQVDYYLTDGLAYLPEPTTLVYVQPNEPDGAIKGSLWFDTDETL